VAALARHRAAAQLLGERRQRSPAEIAGRLVAVQAQDARACALALRARGSGFSAADVAAADDLVVGWLLRGTLHLVRVADWWWLHGLVAAPRADRAPAGREDAGEVRLVVDVLRDAGPLDRAELIAALDVRGLELPGQALPHLLSACCLRGEVLLRPDRRYVVAAAWVGERVPLEDRAAALHELGARYAMSHPGADAADLAAWSGLGAREARVAMDGVSAEPAGAGAGAIAPRLLPAFDPLLLGWKDRSPVVPARLARRIHPGGGMLRAVTLDDGVVTGTWTIPGGTPTLDAPHARRFATEIADVVRFEGRA
jgi:hypothetical protein